MRMARKDVRAARALLDPALADVESFGFHAQQATEKTLKALLALRGVTYPRIHDLDRLMQLLREAGATVPKSCETLAVLTDFGVGFRYDAYDAPEEPFERTVILETVEALLAHAALLIGSDTPLPPPT